MAKYILKKELPFVNLSEPLQKDDTGYGYYLLEKDGKKKFWVALNENELNLLISEGWLEEVKPRTWWELFNPDMRFMDDERFEDHERAIAFRNNYYPKFEIIEVQEVIK